MGKRGTAFAFVAGLTAGIVNLLFGLLMLLGLLIVMDFVETGAVIVVCLMFFAATAVNFAGGCACRNNRIAGGVMMLATAFPMLFFGILCLCAVLLSPETAGTIYGAEYAETPTRAMAAVGLLLLLVESVSGAAGIVSLAAGPKPEPQGLPVDRPPQEASDITEQTFTQRYAVYMKRENDG